MSKRTTGNSTTLILVGITFLWSLSYGVTNLVLPLYVRSIGHTAAQWGLLAGVMALLTVFSEPIIGWIADRTGVVVPWLVSRLVAAALFPLFFLTRNLGVLLILQALRGIVEVALAPLSRKALVDAMGPRERALAIGLFQACLWAGHGIGPLLASAAMGRSGYPAGFLVSSILALAVAVIAFFGRRSLAPMSSDGPLRTVVQDSSHGDNQWQRRTLATACLVAICLFVGVGVYRNFLPLLGTAVLGLEPARVAILLTVASVSSGALMVLLGRVSDRVGRKPMIVLGLAILSAALFGYGYVHSFELLVLCTLGLAVAMALAIPTLVALVSDITPPVQQGQMIGLYGAFENLGLVIGPLVCGALWDAYSPRMAMIACAAIGVVGLCGAAWLPERVVAPRQPRLTELP